MAGACLVVAGALFLWASWDELTCPYVERLCNVTIGLGGLISFLALVMVVLGALAWISLRGRAVSPDGADGWVRVEALMVIFGAVLIALLIPSRVCTAGYRLDHVFGVCIHVGNSADRIDARSQLWLRWVALGTGVVVALPVRFQRRIPSVVAAGITVAVWGVAVWWLLSETVLPRTY